MESRVYLRHPVQPLRHWLFVLHFTQATNPGKADRSAITHLLLLQQDPALQTVFQWVEWPHRFLEAHVIHHTMAMWKASVFRMAAP